MQMASISKFPSHHGVQTPQIPKKIRPLEVAQLDLDEEYSEVTFSGLDFSGRKLENLHFSQVICKQVRFTQTLLAKVGGLDLSLERCDLSGAQWEKGRFRRFAVVGSRMIGCSFMEGVFEDALFVDCNLEGANYINATFKRARFEKCNLRGVSFEGADLSSVVFDQCDNSKSVYINAVLTATDFRGSIIDDMRLGVGDVRGAIFSPRQAVQVAGLLGILIKDDQDEMTGQE